MNMDIFPAIESMNGPELTGTVLGPYLTIPHTASMYYLVPALSVPLLLARMLSLKPDVLGKKWTLKIVDYHRQPVLSGLSRSRRLAPLCKSGTGPEAIAVLDPGEVWPQDAIYLVIHVRLCRIRCL